MGVDAELANQLTLVSVRLTRWLRAADAAATLSGPQVSALAVVVHAGRIRMSDLAALEEVSRPTITRVAAELQALGLIERAADPADARVGWLSATPAGRARLAEGQTRRIAPLAEAMAGLSRQERETLGAAAELLEGLVDRGISALAGSGARS